VELVEFLLARIAEDEAEAVDNEDIFCRRVDDSEGKYWWECSYCRDGGWVASIPSAEHGGTCCHAPPHSPRVLAECQAKRAIVNTLDGIAAAAADTPGALGVGHLPRHGPRHGGSSEDGRCPTPDHPDYREEWRA
jgi:hypothetical protein